MMHIRIQRHIECSMGPNWKSLTLPTPGPSIDIFNQHLVAFLAQNPLKHLSPRGLGLIFYFQVADKLLRCSGAQMVAIPAQHLAECHAQLSIAISSHHMSSLHLWIITGVVQG